MDTQQQAPPYQDPPPVAQPKRKFRLTTQLIVGLIVAVLGVLFTLDNLGVLDAGDYIQFWPIGLLAIGAVQLVQARTSAGTLRGLIWLLIGSVLLGDKLHLLHVNVFDYWPLLLVLVGGYIVWQGITRGATAGFPGGDRAAVGGFAVLGGFDRKVSGEFRVGELTAFMGGGELDLRNATLAGDEAVVDVFAVMGGVGLKVPESWNVIVEVIPFMGGVDDKTRRPAGGVGPRLVVRGFVMMGGIEIKN